MTLGLKTIIYPVADLDRARALYTTLLGVEPVMDAPYYVGYRVGDQDVGLDPNGHSQGMTGPVAYWDVDDIQESLNGLLEGGAETLQPVRDVGGGKLVAFVKDPDGNLIGLVQPA